MYKHLEIAADGVSVVFDKEEDDGVKIQPLKHYGWDEISNVFHHNENILFQLSSGRYHIIVLPYSATESPQQLEEITTVIGSYMTKN